MYNFITIDWTLVDVLYTNRNSLALLYPEILINLNRYWLCNSLIKVVIFGEKSMDKHGLESVREFCDPLKQGGHKIEYAAQIRAFLTKNHHFHIAAMQLICNKYK